MTGPRRDDAAATDSSGSRSVAPRGLSAVPRRAAGAGHDPAPHMHFQPVVELDGGRVVGFEALARDTRAGRLDPPLRMFAEARAAGRLGELDWACRTAALRQATAAGLTGAALLVNTEPQVAGSPEPRAHVRAEQAAPAGLVRMLEITERDLARRPGPLLALVDAARAAGWRIALDDLGAHWDSLSLLPFLRPDLLKLDLALVQERTDVHAAEVVNAVAVQRAATGALVLVEGIETDEHAELARSMGAQLGQGYLLGRPAPLPLVPLSAEPLAPDPAGPLAWPRLTRPERAGTPWQQLPPDAPVRRSTKPLLLGIAHWLERQALSLSEAAVVLTTFERSEYFTERSARRYATLAGSASIVGVFGQRLPAEPAPGVRGVSLDPDDPLCAEWDVLVVGPHFAGALLSRDLGDSGPDDQRRFDYVVTYDRDQVLAAGADLLRRLPDLPDRDRLSDLSDLGHLSGLGHLSDLSDLGHLSGPSPSVPAAGAQDVAVVAHLRPREADGAGPVDRRRPDGAADASRGPAELDAVLSPLLTRALALASEGLAIADATRPGLPLVYVNPAYERLSGYPAAVLLGRNPRLLQAPDTDPAAVRALHTAVATGREVRVTLVNARPDGTRWWNELRLVPVHDGHGSLTHWIGTQQDVTSRIRSEQQAAYLATHDPLTGLANRRRLVEHLPAEIARAGRAASSVAVLSLDLDRFKEINDAYGHPVGDALLVEVAARLGRHRRGGDLLVRQGGDEFLLVLSGLPPAAATAAAAAASVAEKLHDELRRPVSLGPGEPSVLLAMSIGISHYPHDAQDAATVLDHADRALYEVKRHGRDGTCTYGQSDPQSPAQSLTQDPSTSPV